MSAYNAPEMAISDFTTVTMAAEAVIYRGQLVARNAAGDVVPGANTANLTAIGRAEQDVDNTGGAAGDKTILVKRGVFAYGNTAAADAVTKADIDKVCYLNGPTAVRSTAGNGAKAGLVRQLDADGTVWVDTRFAGAV